MADEPQLKIEITRADGQVTTMEGDVGLAVTMEKSDLSLPQKQWPAPVISLRTDNAMEMAVIMGYLLGTCLATVEGSNQGSIPHFVGVVMTIAKAVKKHPPQWVRILPPQGEPN